MGTRDAVANLTGLDINLCLPAYADLGVIAKHEAISRGFHRQAIDLHIAADQAVFDAVGQVADDAALEHDAVLDLGLADLGLGPDGRERSDVGVDDSRLGANHHGTPNHRPLDDSAVRDDDLALDA